VKSFLSPLLRSGKPPFALTNTRNNRIVARTLLTAFDSASRRKGLLDHDGLADGSAMSIAPTSAAIVTSVKATLRWLLERNSQRLCRASQLLVVGGQPDLLSVAAEKVHRGEV
jgi:hypothetical protein